MKDPMQMTADECLIELTASGHAVTKLAKSESGGYDAEAVSDGFTLRTSCTGEPVNALRALVMEVREPMATPDTSASDEMAVASGRFACEREEAIMHAVVIACDHCGFDPEREPGRVTIETHEASLVPTTKVAIDGVPVWQLSWVKDGLVIRGTAEWVGPMALSHAFVPPIAPRFVFKA